MFLTPASNIQVPHMLPQFGRGRVPGGGGDITTGLFGWYKFDEGSGTVAVDSGSSGVNGSLLNGPVYDTGKIGPFCLDFDGATQGVYIGQVVAGNIATEMTVAAWVNPSGFPNAYNMVIGRDGSPSKYFELLVKSNGKLALYLFANNNVFYDGAGTTLATGIWQHVAMTYSAANGLTGYINGSVDGIASPDGDVTLGVTAEFSVGYDTLNPRWFQGKIDDARFYNRELSALDIATLYAYR